MFILLFKFYSFPGDLCLLGSLSKWKQQLNTNWPTMKWQKDYGRFALSIMPFLGKF